MSTPPSGPDQSFDVPLGTWNAERRAWEWQLATSADVVVEALRTGSRRAREHEWRADAVAGAILWVDGKDPDASTQAVVTIRIKARKSKHRCSLSPAQGAALAALIAALGGLAGTVIQSLTATCPAALETCATKSQTQNKQLEQLKTNVANIGKASQQCTQAIATACKQQP